MSGLLYRALLDDAALFPPGNAPMGEALPAHRTHRASPRSVHVGPFLVSEARVAELRSVLAREEGEPDPLDVVVTVPGGADDVPGALDAVGADPALNLIGVEVAAAPGEVPKVTAQLRRHLPDGVEAFVEISRQGRPRPDLEALLDTGHHAKFRTGGVKAEAHPTETELVASLHTAVELGLAFKCTAGLHRAVRHTTTEGFEQHGFLNVLLATAALLDGADTEETARVLADRDGPALARAATALGDTEAENIRATFRSFGTCSIIEPLEDLVVLGVLPTAR